MLALNLEALHWRKRQLGIPFIVGTVHFLCVMEVRAIGNCVHDQWDLRRFICACRFKVLLMIPTFTLLIDYT